MKFYYNARGSLWESKHWILLLFERALISRKEYDTFSTFINDLGKKLNAFINSIKDKI